MFSRDYSSSTQFDDEENEIKFSPFQDKEYKIKTIRFQDRFDLMKTKQSDQWREEELYLVVHFRSSKKQNLFFEEKSKKILLTIDESLKKLNALPRISPERKKIKTNEEVFFLFDLHIGKLEFDWFNVWLNFCIDPKSKFLQTNVSSRLSTSNERTAVEKTRLWHIWSGKDEKKCYRV